MSAGNALYELSKLVSEGVVGKGGPGRAHKYRNMAACLQCGCAFHECMVYATTYEPAHVRLTRRFFAHHYRIARLWSVRIEKRKCWAAHTRAGPVEFIKQPTAQSMLFRGHRLTKDKSRGYEPIRKAWLGPWRGVRE